MTFRTVDAYMVWVQRTVDDRLHRFETSLLLGGQIDVDDLDALMTEQRAAMARWCAEHRVAFEAWLATVSQNR